jgi:hypothetical protein
MSDVRLNRQQDGWAISKPRSLRLLDEHMGMLDLLMAESRSRPEPLKRLEVARAALGFHRERIERELGCPRDRDGDSPAQGQVPETWWSSRCGRRRGHSPTGAS